MIKEFLKFKYIINIYIILVLIYLILLYWLGDIIDTPHNEVYFDNFEGSYIIDESPLYSVKDNLDVSYLYFYEKNETTGEYSVYKFNLHFTKCIQYNENCDIYEQHGHK